MFLWSTGIILVLGIVWFAAAIVVPVWQTRTVLKAKHDLRVDDVQAVNMLGSQQRAARRISQYLWATRKLDLGNGSSDYFLRRDAVWLLGECGEPAVPALADIILDDDEFERDELNRKTAVFKLEMMETQTDDPSARATASEALNRIRRLRGKVY